MNKKVTLSSSVIVIALLAGCASNEEPYTDPEFVGSSSTNIVSAKNFILAFDELNPDVYETATGIVYNDVEVAVTAIAGDRFQAKVSGGTVHFRTEVGLLSADSCELVDGQCSITWFSTIEVSDVPADRINTITAWMTGEEGFTDLNGNDVFDDGDIFTHDESDPFLDLTHDGSTPVYNAGADALIVDSTFTDVDNAYSGTGCSHSNTLLCATNTSTYIFDIQEMNLAF